MKKEIADKWIAALESGDYAQCRGQLRKANKKSKYGFCCLGVLCNIHAQEHPEIAAWEPDPERYLEQTAELPYSVRHWSGISSSEGYISSLATDLVELNDDHRKSFKQIAKIIKEHYQEL
jgi:hypothetical protein